MARVVITGTGRCGTKWCATVLRLAGHFCGHEQVYSTHMLPSMREPDWWRYEADSSLAAVPYLAEMPRDIHRVLVVRHPFDYTRSVVGAGPFLERSQPAGLIEYVTREHPEVMRADNDKQAALRFWVAWNTAGLRHVDAVLPIEHTAPETLLAVCGLEPRWTMFPFLDRVGTGPGCDISLLDGDIPEGLPPLASRLGYEI